jgi:SAM-dependent methyltransferase
MSQDIQFICNLCGVITHCPPERLTREAKSCGNCGSNIRIRSLIRALSLELFDVPLTLPEFPVLKSLRGLGISDIPQYSAVLESKFDYRNTFHDRTPQFDLMHPPESEFGQFDFVLASDVLEHVPPPAMAGFKNAYKLLKRGGVALFSVPYSNEGAGTIEHFPRLNEFSVTNVGGRCLLINRTVEGDLQTFENLVFHLGETPSLEMREFSEVGLKQLLASAGFDEIRWYGDEYLPYGIIWREAWSLPFALGEGKRSMGVDTIRELMGELEKANKRASAARTEIECLNQRRWIKLGRKLGGLRT